MATSALTVTGLADLLDRQARARPHAPALVATGRHGDERVPLSYEALDALADQEAGRFAAVGLGAGDVLGLVAGNTAEFVVALLGAARAGVVAAPLDPGLSDAELRLRVGDLGASAVLRGDEVVTSAGAGRRARKEDALVLFTAGATGRARMVPLTHANVAASVHNICATYALGPDDATVAVMPFFHGHGLFASLLSTLASGGVCCCRRAGGSRPRRSGRICGRRGRVGSRRCRRSTRRCSIARRRQPMWGRRRRCVSYAVVARRSMRLPSGPLSGCSARRCCPRTG